MNSWANSLQQSGFRVTVLTRQWKKGGQNVWEDYYSEYHEDDEIIESVNERYRVIRLPYKWSSGFRRSQSGSLGGFYYWYNKLIGVLHPETNAYDTFFNYAGKFLEKEKADFVIVSSPPLNIIKLGHDLKKKHDVMFIADFRDSFNNKLMQTDSALSAKDKAEVYFFRRYIRKWLQNADGIVGVSQSVLDTICEQFKQPIAIVRNGFEKDLFENVPENGGDEKVTVSLVGNIYPHEEVALMAKGISLFTSRVKPTDFTIQFIGIKGKTGIVKEISQYIEAKYLHFSDRIDRNEALKIMRNSQVLLQIGWKGYKGFCPGKVYEYMAAGRNILIAPADGDLTDAVIKETKTGFSASTIEEVSDYLEEKYNEWKRTGAIAYK